MVATQVRSKAPSDNQVEVANRVALLRTGDWVHEPLLGEDDSESSTNSGDTSIELRVLGEHGLRIGHPDISMPSITRYHVEQEFEGVVLSVDNGKRLFIARLIDESSPETPDEEAVFSFDEISADDLPLIVPGALFSWIMGRTERNRIIERNSEIRFRRVFKFSEFAIKRAKSSAAAMYALLTDEV